MENIEKSNLKLPEEITQREVLENTAKIPIQVNDERNPDDRSFDLEKFLTMIERLRSDGLFKVSRDFQQSDYGKYVAVFASHESDNWDESIQKAKAIEITLTNPASRGIPQFEGVTAVEIKVLMDEKEGRVFRFRFNGDGTYRQGGFDNVHFQKRLRDASQPENFTLDIEPEVKKLKE